MTELKEAIELLENAQKCLHYKSTEFDYLDQALAKLREQPEPCKTCEGNREVEYELDDIQGDVMVPCPDCTAQEQPPASDFTKKAAESYRFREQKQITKDLLEACERVTLMFSCQRIEDFPKCQKGDMCCICAIEAAIAKAKQS